MLDYLYFYNGGGVAIGDVNNDQRPDLFFTGNQVSNRLYLNKGGFTFVDATEEAGVGGNPDEWSTGVTMADVNGDTWLDIYVCQVNYKSKQGRNRLYINNGDGTFTDQAEAYGVDFEGLSTQAAFFDYDRDGDLDMYLLNHAVHTRDAFREAWRRIIDAPRVGDKLYRNDGPRFTDVTHEAGIYSSQLGYGLGLAISDINLDGWPDIYVGNDFHENDYLYFNNGDGTFAEELQRVIGHTSRSSMGNDVADINNDGRLDIVSLDMLPADLATYRKSGAADPEDLVRIKRRFGYAPQNARNTLQLHRGYDPNGYPLFSEVGRYAGIHATDWSWAGLLADLDNDGWNDLFVANGIVRRPNDLDYVQYISQPDVQRMLNRAPIDEQLKVTQRMPSVRIPNYAFRNNGDLTFTDRAADWGLARPSFSNGAAYGDLDNDGDLDLVVSNVNMEAFVYRNNSDSLREGHSLSIRLEGAKGNTTGIGTKVMLHIGDELLYREQMPTRGFQSSGSHVLHFGLGERSVVDSLLVVWPDGRFQRLYEVEASQRLTLRQHRASGSYLHEMNQPLARLFEDVTADVGVDFRHRENDFEDFERQPLIPHKLSTEGPALAVGDVDGNQRDDFYIGGARGQAGALFLQSRTGTFTSVSEDVFNRDRMYEDVDATFADVDGDADLDLFVVSGGGEAVQGDSLLEDRLYLNSGNGRFVKTTDHVPPLRAVGGCVAAADYDADGDIDLFVGSRAAPHHYGVSPDSYLLTNDGTGRFEDVTQQKAPDLHRLGMVTDAAWADIDTDGLLDLVVIGEWMPVTVLQNTSEQLRKRTDQLGLGASSGWWKALAVDDFDGDGDVDLMAGNLGRNAVFDASSSAPLTLFVSDFDSSGSVDPIMAEWREGRLYSWARRDELLDQIPSLQEKLPTYRSYADLSMGDLFGWQALNQATREAVHTLESSYFENQGTDGFKRQALPQDAQISSIQSIQTMDVNEDGHRDALLGGNFLGADTKQGPYDANYGTVLIGTGNGHFRSIPYVQSHLVVRGEVRHIGILNRGDTYHVVIARNNRPPLFFRMNSHYAFDLREGM